MTKLQGANAQNFVIESCQGPATFISIRHVASLGPTELPHGGVGVIVRIARLGRKLRPDGATVAPALRLWLR